MDAGLVVVLAVLGAFLLVPLGVVQVVAGQSTKLLWVSFVLGPLYLLNGGIQYVTYRRMRRAGSVQTQVEGRAEAGRPGAGG